jgi:pimeloyl-ACP methyl ester carboxylesterase
VLGNVFTSPEVYLDKEPLAKIVRPVLTLIKNILKILPSNLKPRGHVDYRKYIGSTDWSIGRNLADMRNTGLRAHFYTLRQSVNKNQEYNLDRINVPTLVIHGEKDTMVPLKNSVFFAKQIRNAKFMSIPNVDHNTVHNAVVKMSEAIESFIENNRSLLQ